MPKLKNKIAVVQLWPELKNAESEVTERIKNSAQLIGVETLVIDTRGICVETGKKITNEDVDFAIHLHFYTPKSYDIFSFVALWNPLQFYHEWGYRQYSRNLLTHDDFLSCDSVSADDHVKRMLKLEGCHLSPQFKLYHSLSKPIHKPKIMQRKLFYVGINWEKLGNSGKSRHNGLLLDLDKTDKLAIYGPKKFQGVDVWEDFKSYVGEIPFDGVTIIDEIAKIGVGLVFSSDAHKDAGLMSNRLFETLAAGAVAICDENPFAEKYLGDSVLYVSSKSETLSQDVLKHLDWLNANPKEAKLLAEKSQKIFMEKFKMDISLQTIYKHLPSRKQKLEKGIHKKQKVPLVGTVFIFTGDQQRDYDNFRQLSEKQDYSEHSIVCLYDKNTDLSNIKEQGNSKRNKKITWVEIDDLRQKAGSNLGMLFHKALDYVQNISPNPTYINLMLSHEHIYHDHISTLVNLAIKNTDSHCVATTGIIINHKINDLYYFVQDQAHLINLDVNIPQGFSRYLFELSAFQTKTAHNLPYLNHRFISVITYDVNIPIGNKVTCEIDFDEELLEIANSVSEQEDQILTDVLGVNFDRPPKWQLETSGLKPTWKRRILVKLRNKIVKREINPILRNVMRKLYWTLIR